LPPFFQNLDQSLTQRSVIRIHDQSINQITNRRFKIGMAMGGQGAINLFLLFAMAPLLLSLQFVMSQQLRRHGLDLHRATD
tara:strand:+ start:687 stop:929 length:243 start_codon:yes stop_codon:yes gene_type:complete